MKKFTEVAAKKIAEEYIVPVNEKGRWNIKKGEINVSQNTVQRMKLTK